MKKIKKFNKLLSSLTLLSPLASIGFNNQYQNTQKVITENSNVLNNNFTTNAEPVQMGDIWVTVDDSDPTIITGYSSGNGTLTVASNIKQIKDHAFFPESTYSGTPQLQGLDLSEATSLTTIGDNAFQSCSNLTGHLMIPNKLETIGSAAFYTTSITSLDLSNATNLTSIEINAFKSCSKLTGNIVIPSSVTSIGNSAFEDCQNLTGDLAIPSSVENIGDLAFSNINLDNLYFLSETPPTLFGYYWQPNVSGKVYVPSEAAKSKYVSAANFGFTEEQIEIGLPPKPSKSNTGLILGLLFGLGIPIILAVGFGIYYLTKKKKTTVKI